MHLLRVIICAALVAGCGADETPVAQPAATPPGFDADLRRDPGVWPELRGGTLELGEPSLVAAPVEVGPPSNIQAQLILPARGRAGVFCGRYGVAVGADGRYGVYRVVAGRAPEAVLDGRVEPGGRSDPGEPTVVRLVCGERNRDDPVVIGYMINASPIAFAEDKDPTGAEEPGRVGALGIGPGDDARYLRFIATEDMP